MDEEILNTVHSMFGTSAKIVDCEKSSSVTQQETLLINGVEIKIDGDDTAAIKTALLGGQIPSVDILNQLLYQAGLFRQPIEFETSLSVKSSLVTTEEVCVSKNGQILDERTLETKEDHIYKSNQKEIWQPLLENRLQDLSLKMLDDCHTFERKEVTEIHNTRKSPQKSATFAAFPNRGVCQKSFSLNDSECDSESDWSTNAVSPDIIHSNSVISSYSAMTATDTPLPVKDTKSSMSCDSGHDGIFHSMSQGTTWVPWNPNTTTVTGNSLSSCYDIVSSSEELGLLKAQQEIKTKPKAELLYRKPQTTISLPFQSFIDDNTVLRYSDNNTLISGPLECLITHLVPTHDYNPDKDFLFTFLLCYRIFLKPRELLEKIHCVWAQQQEFTLRTSKAKIARKLVDVLDYWINEFPYDFRDETVMQELQALTKKCIDIDQMLSKDISKTLQRLVDVLTELDKFEEELQSFSKPNLRRSSEDLEKRGHNETPTTSRYSLMRSESQPITRQLKRAGNCFASASKVQALSVLSICVKHIELAHQLTSIELNMLSKIGAEELLRAFLPEFQCYVFGDLRGKQQPFTAVDENSAKKLSNEKTRNLEAYVQWFNRLSYLTATEIVKCEKKKHRVQMIEYWIECARECFNTGNFNSLMAILAGLNLNAVSRLKKTWSKVQSSKFSVLEHQMDPSLNFSSYRSTMKAAVWRSEGATDARQRVVIPFFTLFLKDLCILNESRVNRLPNGHINFEKCAHIAKQVQDFNKWKRTRCPFEKLPNVTGFLKSTEILNENALLLASFACESPDNNEEKERYKMLRSATN